MKKLVRFVVLTLMLVAFFCAPLLAADTAVFDVVQEPKTLVAALFGVLFFVGEALTFIPAVKANGVFQAVFNIIKSLGGR